jgi:hypothetical protein
VERQRRGSTLTNDSKGKNANEGKDKIKNRLTSVTCS